MRCPFCASDDSQVKDSRHTEDGHTIRRRRLCSSCGARFTTFERVQLRELTVIKKSGRRTPFEREKLSRSVNIALQKRPVTQDQIERMLTGIIRRLESLGNSDVESDKIGEMVMESLSHLDSVGYVRYASVYKDFHAVNDFASFIDKEKLASEGLDAKSPETDKNQ
ncbi:MAG: transcriptional regulator NrdR [Robiginitomaculum sp.]|nr:MAG: transcriptional regulator NrdR [Robiginitomaculum sp.]